MQVRSASAFLRLRERLDITREDIVRRSAVSVATVRNAEKGATITRRSALHILHAVNSHLHEGNQPEVTLDDLDFVVVEPSRSVSAGHVLTAKQFHALPSPLTVGRPPGQMNLPLRPVLVNQNRCLCGDYTERFDQMHEQPAHVQQPASFLSSLEALLALRDRIGEESPSLKVLAVCAHPSSSFLIVKDTVHGIVVGFSSEADYTTYVGMMSGSGGNSHA